MTLDARLRAALAEQFVFYTHFTDDERARFERQVADFVATKRFLSDRGEVDERTKLFLAALACRLSVNLPGEQFGRIQCVNVVDDMPEEDRIGEMAGLLLPTITFTRAALEDAFHEDDDGLNVVYHELAHVLDAADGVCDGIPLVHDPRERETWRRVIARELETLRAARDLRIPTAIRTYGARKKSDLFATATEAFFERPDKLKNAHPAFYALLERFYGQNPAGDTRG
jgi:Mlc titration factor MtfA (ptsG expression regulator)